MQYIVTKRFKGIGMDQTHYNLPYGTVCQCDGNTISYNGQMLCRTTSQNAYDYFSRDDDGHGKERGDLVHSIKDRLRKHPDRWDIIWDAGIEQFKRPEHEDHWIWNFDFYNATLDDLQAILSLIT